MNRERQRWSRTLGSPMLLALLLLGLLVGAASPASADSGSGSSGGGSGGSSGSGSGGTKGDFSISANYRAPAIGYLVRGGLRLADCPRCTTDVEPRYVRSSFGEIFYDSNSLGLVSLNDFAGTITLEVRNLPPGVTSQTATSVFLPRRGAVSTPLRLTAASSAPLGDATITVRATSGSIVHTLSLPISVVDQMPAS